MMNTDIRVDGFSFVAPEGATDLQIDDFPSWNDPAGARVVMCWCYTGSFADGSAS